MLGARRMKPFEGRPRIPLLVVDDDEAILQLLATFLGSNGFEVHTATNPLEALSLLDAHPVKLVITDLMMPHVDGITFTQQIHARPQYKDLPVIMITAYGNDQIGDRSLRKGVALTLAKPIELNKLLDLVGFATAG